MKNLKNILSLFNHIMAILGKEITEKLSDDSWKQTPHVQWDLEYESKYYDQTNQIFIPTPYIMRRIKDLLKSESKLFGLGNENYISHNTYIDFLFVLFIESYDSEINGWSIESLKSVLQPRSFVVGTPEKGLPFVGGSRQGELENIYLYQILRKFGQPTYDDISSDNKVQKEWDIEFDNGVRATIYDYKQYGLSPEDINYWSIGGNGMMAPFEVYKVMGLFP